MLYNKLTFNQKFLAMNMTDQIKQNAYSWRHVCAKHFRLKRLQGYSVSFYLFSWAQYLKFSKPDTALHQV